MEVVAISLKDAEEFLSKHERHYKAPTEPICAIGVGDELRDVDVRLDAACTVRDLNVRFTLHGAAILGRRPDGDGELAHIYVDGTSQGYSLLYGAVWRAFKALGYKRSWL